MSKKYFIRVSIIAGLLIGTCPVTKPVTHEEWAVIASASILGNVILGGYLLMTNLCTPTKEEVRSQARQYIEEFESDYHRFFCDLNHPIYRDDQALRSICRIPHVRKRINIADRHLEIAPLHASHSIIDHDHKKALATLSQLCRQGDIADHLFQKLLFWAQAFATLKTNIESLEAYTCEAREIERLRIKKEHNLLQREHNEIKRREVNEKR